MFGISENDRKYVREFELDNNVDLKVWEIMSLPRSLATQVMRDRILNVKNKKSEENTPKKKRLFRLKIFNRKK